jgi:hypothetical protein
LDCQEKEKNVSGVMGLLRSMETLDLTSMEHLRRPH